MDTNDLDGQASQGVIRTDGESSSATRFQRTRLVACELLCRKAPRGSQVPQVA